MSPKNEAGKSASETKFGEGTRIDPDTAEERARQKARSSSGADNGAQTEQDGEPSWTHPKSWDELCAAIPPELIEGVLYAGSKMGVAAGSKSLKTWLLLYLAYCLANGLPFLKFETTQVLVGYFDFELPEWAIKKRLLMIQTALGGKGSMENIKIWALRGKVRKFRKEKSTFTQLVSSHHIEVAIIDPIYKFLIGKNESDNSIVADLLEDLAEYCDQTGVAIIYVHHHSKGSQMAKEAIDRTSGAGSWGRDPDTLLDLTEHEQSTPEENVLTAEFITRLFHRVPKFVVRWEFPLLVCDNEGLDPEELKAPKKAGRKKNNSTLEILAVLRSVDSQGGASAKTLAENTLQSKSTTLRRLRELMASQRVVKAPIINGYQLSLAERTKWEEFRNQTEN
jgi:hypothetical protein